MAETVHIAIPSDDRYWFFASVTAASAARSCSFPVCVHLVDGGVSDEHWRRFCDIVRCECVRHPFDTEKFPSWHGSGITWSRLWLTELLEGVDWVVSADADVMFRGDVAELWRFRDDGMSILPSRDAPLPGNSCNESAIAWYAENGLVFKRPDEYFCAGLALMNLRRMRTSDWDGRRDEFISAHDYTTMPNADQCVLNYLLQDDKRLLPRQWGAFSGDANADVDWSKSGSVHFVEDAPWRRNKVTHLVSDLVVEWWRLAESLDLDEVRKADDFRGCRSRLDWLLRRTLFLVLKHNQWILKLHPKLWLHLRGTKGIAKRQ